MRRLISIAAVALVAVGVLFAREGMQAPPKDEPQAQKKIIDLKWDVAGPVAPGDSVIFLVGNFAAQHNGAVITCDSAVRYSDMHIEFFGNVLINKNTTYIYGDRADYDGTLNQARVYSDIVKVVDGDATLYTYQFVFNTKTNIGEFDQGGILINRDSRLESVRGYYYGDTKELISVDRVEMRNEEYELKGDSVIYNMATDNAHFFERTNIWSKDGDYLYADRGEYQKADSLYIVTLNGYVLTEKQEMWSDSIDFYRAKNHVILRQNIQIDDAEHKVLAFGDYGEYWKEPGDALLTRRPSMISYDRSQGDSLFMRADSMFLYTMFPSRNLAAERVDSVAQESGEEEIPSESAARSTLAGDKTPGGSDLAPTDSLSAAASAKAAVADSLRVAASDSLAVAAADTVQLTAEQLKAKRLEAAKKAKAEKRAAAAKAKKEKLEQIAAERKEKLLAQEERDKARLAAERAKAASKAQARYLRAKRKGKLTPIDSMIIFRVDSLRQHYLAEQDSLLMAFMDSLLRTAPVDSLDSLAAPADTLYRLIKGYRNVRMFRSDFQAVCDSMTAISTDSTIHLYIDPVLWNQSNQITSDVMDIFTKNQQITRAEFVGSPMMVSMLDTVHYNQIAGKTMTAFFRNNEIYRNDVNGNVETIYYMQDGEPPVITLMNVIESGDASFYIEDKQVVYIVYRIEPVANVYPMDKIPPSQEFYLKGFKWEGARRPSQADVFDRRIRPSDRRARERLPHPDFPIMRRVEEHKKRLLEHRTWADRNDQVDEATVEWMRELGFQVGQPRESGPVF